MTMVTLLTRMAEPHSQSRTRNGTRQNTAASRASYYMLQLYRTNLEVRLQSIDEESLSEHQRRVHSKIAETLRSPVQDRGMDVELEWDETYKVERLSALLYTGAHLRQEITRRLAELADQNVAGSDNFRREYESLTGAVPDGRSPPGDDGVLRAFLLRLVEALQWSAKKKYLATPIRKEATKKILLGVLGAVILLILPYMLLTANYSVSTSEFVSPWWSHLTLYTAVISGGLGAFFSRLIVLQRNWPNMPLEEVCLHNEWSYAFLRAGVGMCGALILFYFLVSGLIDGSVFPHLDKFAIELVVVKPPGVQMAFATPSKDFALLTVWCFLAGFSELLVPGLLAKAERQFSRAGTPPAATR
jgi:hypothetical protein